MQAQTKQVIHIGSDHRGFDLKQTLIQFMKHEGHTVLDHGTTTAEIKSDYVDYAQQVAKAISEQPESMGILICGSGIGMSISANRFKGVRAALCGNTEDGALARKHNDANILVLGAKNLTVSDAEQIVRIFMSTNFEGCVHSTRLAKIDHE